MFHQKHFKFLKTFNSEIRYKKVSFTDHNSKPLELKSEQNITYLVIDV